jgi:hypothetical protein
LEQTLEVLAAAAADLADPWWVFGGAAMPFYGLPEEVGPDVDVLASLADAPTLLARLGGSLVTDAAPELFRSTGFGRATASPLPIEVMAELEVLSGAAWRPVRFSTRLAEPLPSGRLLHTPAAEEHAAMCRLFGRPKDLRRAALLEAMMT